VHLDRFPVSSLKRLAQSPDFRNIGHVPVSHCTGECQPVTYLTTNHSQDFLTTVNGPEPVL